MAALTPPILLALLSLLSVRAAAHVHNPPDTSHCGPGLTLHSALQPPTCPSLTHTHHKADPRSWAPWTHPPFCAAKSPTPYCVFTHAGVAGGRGLSIVTTPELAAEGMSLSRLALASPGLDPAGQPVGSGAGGRFALRAIPGKGMGFVAMQRIPKGERILVDAAMLVAPAETPEGVPRRGKQEVLRVGVERLGAPERVLGLAQRGAPGLSLVEDLLNTNGFGLILDGGDYAGLFPEVSRINHACNPNSLTHFSQRSLSITVWAALDIEPGEEITISYSDVEMSYPDRQKTLRDTWGFKCTCSLCTAPAEVIAASDERRESIRALREETLALAMDKKFPQAVEAAEELLDLADEEGITAHISDFFEVVAKLYFNVNNLAGAGKFIRLALDDLERYGTQTQQGLEKMRQFNVLLAEIQRRKRG